MLTPTRKSMTGQGSVPTLTAPAEKRPMVVRRRNHVYENGGIWQCRNPVSQPRARNPKSDEIDTNPQDNRGLYLSTARSHTAQGRLTQ